MRSAKEGEIVHVQGGGRIIRSTGLKDRHSKVYTSKGPRDRRVRLSAHTAIQFYDVQDRLGYDRPSKAVDWLMKKAKDAIDKLDELPPWNQNNGTMFPSTEPNHCPNGLSLEQQSESSARYEFHLQRESGENPSNSSSYMAPPSDTQSIADTMKSLFPTSSGISLTNFQHYPPDIMSRASMQTQDLGLSLHTLQDHNSNHRPNSSDHSLYSGPNPLTFEPNSLKMAGWNGSENADNRVGFIFNSHSMLQQPFLGQISAFSQREPLQSNYLHLVHAWDERSLPSVDHQIPQVIHQSSISNSHFNPHEFQAQLARFHGEQTPGIVSVKLSNDSPNSHN